MLKIYKPIKNNKLPTVKENNIFNFTANNSRHYPSANTEWLNSLYSYNSNYAKSSLIRNNLAIKIIKNYFNMYNIYLEKKAKLFINNIKLRRSSINKILMSEPTIKHTNEKVIINMYVYDRQKFYLLNKIKKLQDSSFINSGDFNKNIILVKQKYSLIASNINGKKYDIINTLKWNYDKYRDYKFNYYNMFFKKYFQREILLMLYKKIILFNSLKLKNTYIYHLSNLLEKIFNKKVIFNIVSLKYFYLNIDVLLQVLSIKLRRRNVKIIKVLNRLLQNIKVPLNNDVIYSIDTNKKLNTKFNNKNKLKHDKLSVILNDNYLSFNVNENITFYNNVLNLIKFKTLSGVRIEASGRLSKRITASRSIYKVRYKGNLKNIDSYYKGLSSSVLRGNLKSNLQYTNLNYKTRIGSYGLKGWTNSI